MLETLNRLMAYAIEQFGRSRIYTVRFGSSTPIVSVADCYSWDGSEPTRIAELWDADGETKVERF
jgi:hypothetical protein